TQRKRIVATHTYFLISYYIYNILQCLRIVHQGIYPEFPKVIPRINIVIYGAQVGTNVKTMLYAAYSKWETAATVCKSHSQLRKLLKNTPKYHRTFGSGSFCRHTNQPGQPVFHHVFFSHHFPWV